jgi:hypothetical protein
VKLPRLLAIGFLVLGTSFFFIPDAQAEQTGPATITCAKEDGTQRVFNVQWDNSNLYFNGKGDIARLFCEGGHAPDGHSTFVSTSVPDGPLRYYNGVAPEPTVSPSPEPSAAPSPSLSPEPTPSLTPEPSQTATATSSPSPSVEQTMQPSPSPTPESTQLPTTTPSASDTPTSVVETSTTIIDTSTVVDTVTVIVDTTTVVSIPVTPEPAPQPAPEPTPIPTPVPAVQPEPTPTPVAQPAPEAPPEPPVVAPEPTPPVVEEPPAPVPVEEEPPAPEPEPVAEPEPVPVEEPAPEPQPEPLLEEEPAPEPEPEPEPVPEPAPEPVIDIAPEPPVEEPEPPVVATEDSTPEERKVIAEAVIEAAQGEPVTVQAIQDAGLTYEDLPSETPVEVREDENGNEVVITAEVAAALVVLESPAALIEAIFTDPGQALLAIASIGADMSDEEREESEKIIVASVIAGQTAVNAASMAGAAAAYRRKP